MRFLNLAVGFAALSLSAAYAQRGGGHGGGGHYGGYRGGGGFGSGSRVVVSSGYRGGGHWVSRPIGPRVYFGFGSGWYYPSYAYVPYGGGYYSSYDPYYAPQPQPSVAIQPQDNGGYYPPPQQQSQQAPQYDPRYDQRQPEPVANNDQQPPAEYYLIAFKDHTIQAATAYKVEGDRFFWITRDNQEKQAPLSSVDVEFSQKINQDRRVDFQIP